MSGAFVGIDPGLDGGIAAIGLDHGGGGAVWQTWRMPTARDGSKRVIDREAFEQVSYGTKRGNAVFGSRTKKRGWFG